MKSLQKIIALSALVLGIISFASVQNTHAAPYHSHLLKGGHQKVCAVSSVSITHCFANVLTDRTGRPAVTTLPAGYGPAQIHGAYQLPNTSSNPGTIAIVDAYDDPNVTADLTTY